MEFQDEDEFRNEQPLKPETFTNDFSGNYFLAHQFCSHNTFANKFRVHTTQLAIINQVHAKLSQYFLFSDNQFAALFL